MNVLVVENHADTRRSVQIFLHALGHHTAGADSIAVALARAGQTRFDLLLSDILLPDGDGWELLARLEAAGCRPARAVAMSGLGHPGDMIRSRVAGFELHLVKPFAPEALEPILRHAAEGRGAAGGADTTPGETVAVGGGPETDTGLAQKMHDGLCQQLAAASLLQQALVMRLEAMASPELAASVADARYIARLLNDAITETRMLMREARGA